MEKKIALVSGANKGIGKETVRQLGKLGFKVILGCRDLSRGEKVASELRNDGIDVDAVQFDVSNENSVKAATDSIQKKFGRLDVLVNNAGILTERNSDIRTINISGVEETIQTNFIGALRLLQAAIPLLEKSDAPRIVNVSSSLGSLTTAGDPNSGYGDFLFVGYCCSKAALNMLTVIAASTLKNKKFKVNSICPGYVATDINDNQGFRTVEQGAAIIIKMATLDDNGPTGTYVNDEGIIPW